MNPTTIHLGFEVATGKPVEIPIRHTVITGQTQEAGKTTTLEALISRTHFCSVAFVTKRGEQSFATGRRIPPYFCERADWQFVASVLEATMKERLKFERGWIMRASKGAKTLADVQRNVRSLMEKARGLSADVYYVLNEYLDIVVPRIAAIEFAHTVDLLRGLSVIDLSDTNLFPSELQSLIMRSVLEWMYKHVQDSITIIPEAWEFLPQRRGSPVKLAATELIRKGAGLRNYVWLDSQDIGGVEKEILRSCPVWLLGVQREANEIKRTLDNIPAGIAKPKPSDLATLGKGQFYACWSGHVIKTYVQPAWMDRNEAQTIAATHIAPPPPPTKPVETTTQHSSLARALAGTHEKHQQPKPIEEHVTKEHATQLEQKLTQLERENERLRNSLAAMEPRNQQVVGHASDVKTTSPSTGYVSYPPTGDKGFKAAFADAEVMANEVIARVMAAPPILALRTAKPTINVHVARETVTIDGKSLRGRIAKLIADGWWNQPRTTSEVLNELRRRGGTNGDRANYCREIDALTEKGFLTRESERTYAKVPGMEVNIIKE